MAKKWHQLERLDHKALKKLQKERVKAAKVAQASIDKKRNVFIGIAIFVAVFLIGIFMMVIRGKSQAKAIKVAREKLKVSQVISVKGKVLCRDIGIWEPTQEKMKFSKAYSFKTEEKAMISVQLQLENVLKLSQNSEMRIDPPKLEKKELKVKSEKATLKDGEMTVAIALDGRELLEIKVGKVSVKASSGLFKIIYDKRKDKGEVVVKNGVVSVKLARKKSGGKKVTGFYKIVFKGRKIGSPTQASVIQYDWR